MRVLFADFDGVINSHDFPRGDEFPPIWFDTRLVTKLNDIIRDTDIKVVVSSDWRLGRSINQLQGMLEDYGFIGEIIGVTGAACDLFGHQCPSELERERVWEINDWLAEHPAVTMWCAIDDLDLGALSNFVLTDFRTGISDENVQQARAFFAQQ